MTPYYDDGHGIVIYHGDCREVLPELALKSVDHVIMDPPFEVEAHTLQRRTKPAGRQNHTGNCIEVLPLPFAAIDEALRADVAREIARLVRRWLLTFCQIEASQTWRAAFEAHGLVYRRTCLWIKPDGMPQYSGDRPGMGYETFVAMHAPGASRWNCGGRHGVWVVNKGEPGGAQPHPTTKPLLLMSALVAAFTDPGDLVLDPFAGSGTTGRACKDLGRRCIMIEKEERYCEIAAHRQAQDVLDFGAEESLDSAGEGP